MTVSIDLYGKGYTDAPKTDYHTNLFVTQLALLLQYLKWDHAHIAGFSMVRILLKSSMLGAIPLIVV